MRGQNTCHWLVIGSTELCGKTCLGDHCKIHLARLRRGPGTQPCKACRKGVKNRFGLCQDCGYYRAQIRAWQRSRRAYMVKFKRLAAIEIPI